MLFSFYFNEEYDTTIQLANERLAEAVELLSENDSTVADFHDYLAPREHDSRAQHRCEGPQTPIPPEKSHTRNKDHARSTGRHRKVQRALRQENGEKPA